MTPDLLRKRAEEIVLSQQMKLLGLAGIQEKIEQALQEVREKTVRECAEIVQINYWREDILQKILALLPTNEPKEKV